MRGIPACEKHAGILTYKKNRGKQMEKNNGIKIKTNVIYSILMLFIIGIFVYKIESAYKINELLHEYNQYIIGRMGIPYKDKQVSVISIIVDGPNDIIGALSGKLGMVEGVSVKALYSKKENE